MTYIYAEKYEIMSTVLKLFDFINIIDILVEKSINVTSQNIPIIIII